MLLQNVLFAIISSHKSFSIIRGGTTGRLTGDSWERGEHFRVQNTFAPEMENRTFGVSTFIKLTMHDHFLKQHKPDFSIYVSCALFVSYSVVT